MPLWDFYHTPKSGSGERWPLRLGVDQRVWTRRLNVPDEVSFKVDGRQVSTNLILPFETDILAFRDDLWMSTCRVLPVEDVLEEARHITTVKAFGLEALLGDRYTVPGDTLTFTGVDQAQIVWTLINASQGRTNGSLGITQGVNGFTAGVGSTGVTRILTIPVDQSIGGYIKKMAQMNNGFDFEIDEEKRVQVYYPARGKTTGTFTASLEYGVTVKRARRTFSWASYSNVMALAAPGGGYTRNVVATAGLATDPRGRVERVLSVPQGSDPFLYAQAALTDASRSVYTWNVDLIQGGWFGTAHIDVGDVVQFRVQSNPRISFEGFARVHAITVRAGTSGEEDVSMVLEEL